MTSQLKCPHCGQNLEAPSQYVGVEVECPSCGKQFVGAKDQESRPIALKIVGEVNTNVKQGAVIGGWVCFALAVILMFVSLWSFFIYGPLLLAACILSIVAMSQRRVVGGLLLLLSTLIVAPIILLGLGATRISKTAEQVSRELEGVSAVSSPSAFSQPLITEETGAVEKSTEEAAAYAKDFIDLYEFTSAYYDTWSDEKVPGVEFKIRNRGTRTLTKLVVTVYFKDANGNTIAEEDYYPVLVTELGLLDNKPLKPGYIWQMEQGKFYTAKNVPSEWKEGAAEGRITDIEFAEEEK